ncbi:conserved membrane hypothetical protein [Rubrivivax sp. A210]|uniref:hypothetical protein n=1 Tax=Rubrivivax sp. A210 TaxID=2772301 RepID=UPI001918F7F3|nr:hypothetical protein [Rubrivivax sp. A210]CAD5373329.1 conserved membrane hypothetical protein [Rubrivivax sp. A210]
MKTALLLLAPALALATLAAHFYRAGSALLWACVLLLALLGLRRAWVARLEQGALLLGAGEWAWTAALLAQERLALGQPWLRLVMILSAVALFTAATAVVFQAPRLRRRYGPG